MRSKSEAAPAFATMTDPAPRVGDAFGQMLRRCWTMGARSGVSFEILEREDGCLYAFDAAGYFTPPDQWPRCERTMLDYAQGGVLDIGCGGGRHTVALAEAGYDVTGIDTSAGAVAVCQERDLPVLERSLDDLTGLGTFDTFLLLGNNTGLLRSRSDARRLLCQLGTYARAGCRILCSSVDPFAAGAPEHEAYRRWNAQRGRLPGQQRTRVRDRMLVSPWFDYLYVSPDGLAELLDGSPWSLAEVEQTGPSFMACLRLVG